jgi:hypothetical protein
MNADWIFEIKEDHFLSNLLSIMRIIFLAQRTLSEIIFFMLEVIGNDAIFP